jgi:hypothetical protein
VIHEELGLKRFLQGGYTPEEKKYRVSCAKHLLDMFESKGPKRISDIDTGDETWIYFYGIPKKNALT